MSKFKEKSEEASALWWEAIEKARIEFGLSKRQLYQAAGMKDKTYDRYAKHAGTTDSWAMIYRITNGLRIAIGNDEVFNEWLAGVCQRIFF